MPSQTAGSLYTFYTVNNFPGAWCTQIPAAVEGALLENRLLRVSSGWPIPQENVQCRLNKNGLHWVFPARIAFKEFQKRINQTALTVIIA